tara:strand:+ start:119 stop:376 length:258 start_codon:yes stop_codon:yes gene_type:complete
MKPSLECQQNLCKELSRARTLHFAHTVLQHKTIEQQAEFIDMIACKLHVLVDCFTQSLKQEQPEQPEEKDGRRWWLDGELENIGM